MLENEHVPLLRRRAPYWRPRPAACFRDVHTPAWSWTHPEAAGASELPFDVCVLDRNGAFISAASSASFAHGGLEHTGALPAMAGPGYYRIDFHPWQDDRIVSPLGDTDLSGKVWVAHPTLELLEQLERAGFWPEIRIHDSWTCPDSVRFREWATAVNNVRAEALRTVDAAERCGAARELEQAQAWYTAVKNGYSMAVQLMLGPAEGGTVKSAVKRPDWYHTIHAQHAATTWRYVWKAVQADFEPVMMGSVDEVAYPSEAVAQLQERGLIKVDPSGIQLGAFKVKEHIPAAVTA
jgi:hypothetical protein